MKNALAKNRNRNALAYSGGYVGPKGYTEGARANMRMPTMDDVRAGAELAEASFLPGISDAAAGVLAVDEARKGNYGAAGLNALGLLPFVPAMGGIFIGKGAKTWDAVKAAEAQKLLDSGTDPRQVWQQTGTFKGADGALRQEIDDTRAGIRLEGPKFGADPETAPYNKLGETLDHRLAYDAYPDAKGINVAYQAEPGGSYSAPRGAGQYEYMYLQSGAGKDSQRGTALHELQHAIQQREGWARGGSPEAMMQEMGQAQQARIIELDDAAAAAMRKGDFDAYSRLMEEANQMRRQPLDNAADAYRSLAGEAEARAVQKRMNYPMEQRRAVYPFDDYDVPVNSLILRTNR